MDKSAEKKAKLMNTLSTMLIKILNLFLGNKEQKNIEVLQK